MTDDKADLMSKMMSKAQDITDDGEALSKKIIDLFEGHSIPTIGLALGMSAGVLIARAELEDKGEATISLLEITIRAFGRLNIEKIQNLKSDPSLLKATTITEH